MAPRTVLVTGCASGIGEATARAFRDSAWSVSATDADRGRDRLFGVLKRYL